MSHDGGSPGGDSDSSDGYVAIKKSAFVKLTKHYKRQHENTNELKEEVIRLSARYSATSKTVRTMTSALVNKFGLTELADDVNESANDLMVEPKVRDVVADDPEEPTTKKRKSPKKKKKEDVVAEEERPDVQEASTTQQGGGKESPKKKKKKKVNARSSESAGSSKGFTPVENETPKKETTVKARSSGSAETSEGSTNLDVSVETLKETSTGKSSTSKRKNEKVKRGSDGKVPMRKKSAKGEKQTAVVADNSGCVVTWILEKGRTTIAIGKKEIKEHIADRTGKPATLRNLKLLWTPEDHETIPNIGKEIVSLILINNLDDIATEGTLGAIYLDGDIFPLPGARGEAQYIKDLPEPLRSAVLCMSELLLKGVVTDPGDRMEVLQKVVTSSMPYINGLRKGHPVYTIIN